MFEIPPAIKGFCSGMVSKATSDRSGPAPGVAAWDPFAQLRLCLTHCRHKRASNGRWLPVRLFGMEDDG